MQAEFLQSKDEEGNWHVAFGVDGASQSKIVISGFENPQPTSLPDLESKTDEKTHDFLYYVVAVVAAAVIGIFSYRYTSKKKLTT